MSNKAKIKKLDRRNILYLVAILLTTAYFIYMFVYLGDTAAKSETDSQAIGLGLAIVAMIPHLVLVGIAYIFNWVAYALKENWAGLVAGILYSVSILFMFIYAPFVLIQLVLCFVAYAKVKKRREELRLGTQQTTYE